MDFSETEKKKKKKGDDDPGEIVHKRDHQCLKKKLARSQGMREGWKQMWGEFNKGND